MKGFVLFAAPVALVALMSGIGAAPLLAQTPAPAAPRPATPAAPRPATPAPALAQPQVLPPPVPFPQGAKIAFVNLPAVFQLSKDGKTAAEKIQKATADKQKEAETKAKALQTNQQKLDTGGSVMTEAARTQLEKEIDRQQKEGERFEQDAQAELTELQQEVQTEFQKKLFPILGALSQEKGLQLLFSMGDSGLVWADPGLDLTLEAVKRLDAGEAPKAAAPAAAPAAPK
jgi:outer membrane protein